MGIYRIDPEGSVHRIVSELWKPNGIAISPDESTIYVVTVGSFTMDWLRVDTHFDARVPPSAIHAFDLHSDGTVTYVGGTSRGPEAILAASKEIESF